MSESDGYQAVEYIQFSILERGCFRDFWLIFWLIVLDYLWHQFTFTHLADAFIQSDLFRLYIFGQYVFSLGIEPATFCAANTMFYHWAKITQFNCYSVY